MFVLKKKVIKIGWIVLEIWALYSLAFLQKYSNLRNFVVRIVKNRYMIPKNWLHIRI